MLSLDKLNGHIATVQDKLLALDESKRAEVDEGMALTFEDHFRFQQMQAEAHVSGLLSTEAAQLIYVTLGEVGSPRNGGWAADATTAQKVTITQLMGELLERRLAA